MSQKKPVSEPLLAISPLDGRYHGKTEKLSFYVSEFALIKARVEVEITYLKKLSKYKIVRKFTQSEIKKLDSIIEDFSLKDAEKVKKIEEETRHDVKAVERFLRQEFSKSSLKDVIEMIHFGLTSEDINNISYRLLLKRGTIEVLVPELEEILSEFVTLSKKYADFPFLARTHGQAAVPTTLGKEMVVFASRIDLELKILKKQNLTGKINGAVGNFNALYFAYPKIDWVHFSEELTDDLGLSNNLINTQINTYEDVTSYLQILQRINLILIDFNQDMWRYISDGWFIQTFKKGEVGSSTMPQKVNPIDFENSEGNLGIANALIEHMVRKLPVSRLQRDLTDSTTIRNIGTILGNTLLAYKSTLTGLSRVLPNEEKITADLFSDWSTLTEGVQTYLRKIGVQDPYVLIATLSKGRHIGKKEWEQWINKLPIEDDQKAELESLTPATYIGLAETLTITRIKEIIKR